MNLGDLILEAFSVDAPKSYSPQTQLPLPKTSFDLPKPLSYYPDMGNQHSAQNWLDAGAQKIVYSTANPTTNKNVVHAILYLGFVDCLCGDTLPMYAYADWIENRNPLCGHGFESYDRGSKRSDDQYLKKSDYSLGAFLVGPDCEPWKDGGPTRLCAVEGNGQYWQLVSIGSAGGACLVGSNYEYAAFFKKSDSTENPDPTTPNVGFKIKWDLLNPPVPNGKGSAVDLTNDYDPATKTLAVRQHYSLGINSKCGVSSFSMLPPLPGSMPLDNQPWNYEYVGFENLQSPLTNGPPVNTPESPASSMGKLTYFAVPLIMAYTGIKILQWKTNRINEKKRRGIR
jgi:hypothetical protein